jgi:ribosomal protein S18 acetylase RimI-like enzyme
MAAGSSKLPEGIPEPTDLVHRLLQSERRSSAAAFRTRRRADRDDAFIVELGRRVFGEYDLNAARTTASLARRGRTLVVCNEVKPVGFVILEPPDGGVVYLSAIAVVEEARGKGAGRALLRAAETLARTDGANRLELTTADSNVAALELFLRSGFVRTAGVGDYGRGQPALRLQKIL